MNVSVGPRWESFIAGLVKQGRYASATEVMREGLRLVEERERGFAALKAKVNGSIARGGENSDEDVGVEMKAHFEARRKRVRAAAARAKKTTARP